MRRRSLLSNRGGYEPESLALFERMTTEPTTSQKNNYNTLIKELIDSGVWAKRDAIWVTGTYLEEYAILNLKADAYNMIAMLSPTFEVGKGFTSDGSTSYLRTQYNLVTDGATAVLNDSGFSIGFQDDSAVTSWDFGAYRNTLGRFAINTSDTTFTFYLSSTDNIVLDHRTTKGIHSFNVTSNVETKGYSNRFEEVFTTTTQVFPNDELYALGFNFNGSPFINGTKQLSFLAVGGALTETEVIAESEAIDAFLLPQGTNILPATPDSDLIVVAGQSNAIGYYPEDILPVGWNEEQTNIDTQYVILTGNLWEKMNPHINSGFDIINTNNYAPAEPDSGWSVEQTAAHEILEDGNNVLVFKNGITSKDIYNWDNTPTDDLLQNLTFYLNRLIEKKYYDDYGSLKSYNPIPKSMIWMQGESDAATPAGDYESRLRNIISEVRAIDGIGNIQFVMVELPDIMTSLTQAHRDKINLIFNTIAGDTANCIVLNPDTITGVTMRADNLHYTAASNLLIGSEWKSVIV